MFKNIILASMLSVFAVNSFANEMHNPHKKAPSSQKQEKKIFNIYCPVTGGPVNQTLKTVSYKGKTIGFCCPGCDKIFLSDPEKFLKNLSADGQHWTSKAKQQEH